jgi:hypothetical protein
VYITNSKDYLPNPRGIWINNNNIVECSIYFTIRHIFEHTWVNHNDQFLIPNIYYKNDIEFCNDCLIYTLLHTKNAIQSRYGINHWIPYAEKQVDAKEKFESNFMSELLKRKTFSPEAQTVLNAGCELWKYYHTKIENDKTAAVNASFYDIREYFQGRNENGTMKAKSDDETYNALIKTLREKHKKFAKKIEPKIYKYGFLKE